MQSTFAGCSAASVVVKVGGLISILFAVDMPYFLELLCRMTSLHADYCKQGAVLQYC